MWCFPFFEDVEITNVFRYFAKLTYGGSLLKRSWCHDQASWNYFSRSQIHILHTGTTEFWEKKKGEPSYYVLNSQWKNPHAFFPQRRRKKASQISNECQPSPCSLEKNPNFFLCWWHKPPKYDPDRRKFLISNSLKIKQLFILINNEVVCYSSESIAAKT